MWLRLKLVWALLIGILVFLQYRLWVEPGGIRDTIKLNQTLTEQAKQNDQLKKQNELLISEVKRLKKNPDITESRARKELGMIKKDEIFYQVVR